MRNKIYFLSDTHLGSAFHKKHVSESEREVLLSKGIDVCIYAQHQLERKLCRWLDSVKSDAKAIYMLGDIFDYWFEYKNVAPRGFTRFIGKLAEVSDSGVELHFFIGNHDIWLLDYLEKECGLIVHRDALIKKIGDKNFFLSHGDGLGDNSKSFKLLRKIFHSTICRIPYAAIHPRWTVGFAHRWSNHSRETGVKESYLGEDKEHLVSFAKDKLKTDPSIDFFIFGHRHIMLDLMLAASNRVIILGDWITYFSYGEFDGKNFELKIFEDEEC